MQPIKTMNKQKSKIMNAGHERKRMESAPDYPVVLPDLRCRITIERFYFGYEKNVLELYKTSRIDQYRVMSNGKLWKWAIGMSRIFERVRKAIPRVRAM